MSYADELDWILADARRPIAGKTPNAGETLFSDPPQPEGVELTNTLLLLVLKALVVIGKILDEKS